MIDHMGISVKDFEHEAPFYAAALAPLGYRKGAEHPGVLELIGKGDSLWIEQAAAGDRPLPRHIAFKAADTKAVKDFYAAALAHGGIDNGEPGPRPKYGTGYYAAFAHDMEGNNIEAVMHDYRS